MADSLMTLLDLAKFSGNDRAIPLIDAAAISSPELGLVYGRPISGTKFTALKRVSVQSTSRWSAFNKGGEVSKATYTNVEFATKMLKAPLKVDATVNKVSPDGLSAAETLTLLVQDEMDNISKQVGQAFYTGNSATGDEFDGLDRFLDSTYSVNAGGSGTVSKAYFVHVGIRGVHFIWGGNVGLSIAPWTTQMITASSGGDMLGLVSQIDAAIGLAVTGHVAVSYVYNIDATHPLTDALVSEALSKLPTAAPAPTHAFMNKSTLWGLRKSRTPIIGATIGVPISLGSTPSSSSQVIAPPPTEVEGMVVVPTDNIIAA